MHEALETKPVYAGKDRPADGQRVIYYFEPFEQWYVGKYTASDDSVIGRNGFSSWLPEVTKWMDGTQ